VRVLRVLQGNIANLIDRLKVEYDARDKLWADLQAQITDLGTSVLIPLPLTQKLTHPLPPFPYLNNYIPSPT
jgi:hypothetical protein